MAQMVRWEEINRQLVLDHRKGTIYVKMFFPHSEKPLIVGTVEGETLRLNSTQKWAKGVKRYFTINKNLVDYLLAEYNLKVVLIRYKDRNTVELYRIRASKLLADAEVISKGTGFQGPQYEINVEDCLEIE